MKEENNLTNIIKASDNQKYVILKKGLFPRTRAHHEFDKIENVKAVEITAFYDFSNPISCIFKNEYKIVYVKI